MSVMSLTEEEQRICAGFEIARRYRKVPRRYANVGTAFTVAEFKAVCAYNGIADFTTNEAIEFLNHMVTAKVFARIGNAGKGVKYLINHDKYWEQVCGF